MNNSELKDITKQLDLLTETVQKLSKESAGKLQDEASETVEEMKNMAKEKTQKAKEVVGDVVENAKQFGQQADEYVKDYPWLAVGAVAAVSILAGMALANKQSKR